MGTSKGYSAPTDPQWSKLKGTVTRVSRNGAVPNITARNVLRDYIRTNGGARRVALGGGSVGGSRAAQALGQRLAGFAKAVATTDLGEALREVGLVSLIGKSAREIAFSLIDKLCDDGSTLDEVDARQALSDLMGELLEDADTYHDVEKSLNEKFGLESIGNMLLRFFGYYLYHQFCRIFFERLVTRHGEPKASGFLESIRQFIGSELRYKTYEQDITRVDWTGKEGEIVSDEIIQRTLEVFGG